MPRSKRRSQPLSVVSLSLTTAMLALCVVLALLTVSPLLSQEPSSPAASGQGGSTHPPQPTTLLIPAGTKVPLVLTQLVSSKTNHVGDDLHAQTTSPVVAGADVVIPAGTYVLGKISKMTQQHQQVELALASASLVFGNNYVVHVQGPIKIHNKDEWLRPADLGTDGAAVLVLFAAPGVGGMIGAATASNKGRGAGIGIGVGAGIGVISALALHSLHHGPNFVLDVGSPMDTVIETDVALDRDKVADAVAHSRDISIQPMSQSRNPAANPPGTTKSPFDCPPGEEWCSGRCVSSISFMSDSSNCGRCGNHCSISQSCTGGSCGCAAGYTSCMGSCVSSASFISDNSNCGRCGNSCSFGKSCVGGSCTRTSPCTPGDINCQ